jgi:hypothetical protein
MFLAKFGGAPHHELAQIVPYTRVMLVVDAQGWH